MGKQQAVDLGLQGSNRLVTVCLSLECTLIMLAYLIGILANNRAIGAAIPTIIISGILIVALWSTYLKKPDSEMIKHIFGIGFPILYTYVMFSSKGLLTFTYAIPIIIIAAAYADAKYTLKESTGMIILNVIQVVLYYKNGVYGEGQNAMGVIQLSIVILVGVYQFFSVRRIETNNRYREMQILEENQKTKEVLDNNLRIGEKTNATVDEMHDMIQELGETIRKTTSAMREVDLGASETASTVETQLTMTGEISDRVRAVALSSETIVSGLQKTVSAVNQGESNVEALVAQADETKEKGNQVSEKLTALNELMAQMGSVVKLISNITRQTSMLSLNASIEAARAGEAGRGFTVVATEIQGMAGNTQSAANEIEAMIRDVSEAIAGVVEVAMDMIEDTKKQEGAIRVLADSFGAIEESAKSMNATFDELTEAISKLEESNNEIVNSISTISAITEEVSAHANDTVTACENNIETVDQVIGISGQLRELASMLTQ